MKRIVSSAMAAALAFSLVACGGAGQTNAAQGTGEKEAAAESAVVGGWTINTEFDGSEITDEQAAMFEQAMSEADVATYQPVAVVASQLVSGMNYAYLCTSTVAAPDAPTTWAIVVIYQDLNGKCSFTCANELNPADLHLAKGTTGDAVGAWSVILPDANAALPEKAHEAFAAATEALMAENQGYALNPLALLATQVVSGTNYQFLCVGSLGGEEPQLIDATIYQDLDGNVSVTSIDALDLTFYVTPPAA